MVFVKKLILFPSFVLMQNGSIERAQNVLFSKRLDHGFIKKIAKKSKKIDLKKGQKFASF